MAKSVCIIGGGPSGLIAAKTLIHNHAPGTFLPTIFESSSRIGGLWPLPFKSQAPSSPSSHARPDIGMVNPRMRTNISRWNMGFSDFSWKQAAGLFQEKTEEESINQFPRAVEVGAYLEAFVEKFDLGKYVRTGSEVVGVTREAEKRGWSVEVETRDTGDEVSERRKTHHFDFVIAASGFFAKPKIPPGFELVKLGVEGKTPVLHSTQFRRVKDFLGHKKGRKIVVIGGSMSGAEVAAAIAMELSSAANSPGEQEIDDAGAYSVHHVMKRPFWAVPSLLPTEAVIQNEGLNTSNPSSPFLPLDLTMFELSRRPPGLLQNFSGNITPEAATKSNERFEALLGTNQTDLCPPNLHNPTNSSALKLEGAIRLEAPWIAISDHYAEFARSGLIVPSLGYVDAFDPQTSTVQISTEDGPTKLDNVAAIILATGFESTASLSFLPPDILDSLSYDPSSGPFPLLLNLYGTSSPKYPDLGFVGLYRGPYWGVIELQSRLLAKIFSESQSTTASLQPIISDDGAEKTKALRDVYKNAPKQLAQFPMGDYVYLMESLRSFLSSPLFPIRDANTQTNTSQPSQITVDPIIPARYPSIFTENNTNPESAQSNPTLKLLSNTLEASQTRGKFVAAAIFRALHGRWSIHRKLTSNIASYPSGIFTGIVTFSPREPTEEGFDKEYLYLEEGELVTETGMKFQAKRGYVYRYTEATDTLSAWFVKPMDPLVVDYLFHEVEIIVPRHAPTPPRHKLPGWKAKSSHLCIADTYDVEYEFWFKGVAIREWKMEYQVRGPNKDYRIENSFTR